MNSFDYFRTYFSESDRGCVLIVAGELDRMLKELHEAKMNLESSASGELRKRLFHGHGPLSTFASRIQLGFAYGLIPKCTFEDLERLRDIRNKAAHSAQHFSLLTMLSALTAITAVERNVDVTQFTPEEVAAAKLPDKDSDTVRVAFASMGMALANEIMAAHSAILESDIARRAESKG
jgi:DNA-binding MltR family transcriptional regulator